GACGACDPCGSARRGRAVAGQLVTACPRNAVLLYRPAFFFYYPAAHRYLHSFPTRRSSDLGGRGPDLTRAQKHHGNTDGELFHKDRKSTRLNSSHDQISYAVFCLKKKKSRNLHIPRARRPEKYLPQPSTTPRSFRLSGQLL